MGIKDIPPVLAQQLLISGEDHRFFRHGGVDPIVRVVSGRFERTFKRKIREIAIATLLTSVIPKEQLPALYLQIGYYGWHMNGFGEACRRLGINIDSLTPVETAQLVARLKYPQPRFTPPGRWNQINIRGQHLLRLYIEHKSGRTYKDLINVMPIYETI